MRELGFSQKWPKLERYSFTTFRFPRKDKDWEVAEIVRVVYRPRSKDREILCVAQIMGKKPMAVASVSLEETKQDGFASVEEMLGWMRKTHGARIEKENMNKLSLVRVH